MLVFGFFLHQGCGVCTLMYSWTATNVFSRRSDYAVHFPFLRPPQTLGVAFTSIYTHQETTPTREMSVSCRSYSNVPLSPVIHAMKKWNNAIHFLSFRNTHTHTLNIDQQQLGICCKWWNRNVQRHTEIGFFSDTLTSCSWEDWNLIFTYNQRV